MLLQNLEAEALKFQFFKVKYIRQVTDFYINLKAKLVKFLRYWKKSLGELNPLNLKRKLF